MTIGSIFTATRYNLLPFILCFPVWYVVPRKNWQPWVKQLIKKVKHKLKHRSQTYDRDLQHKRHKLFKEVLFKTMFISTYFETGLYPIMYENCQCCCRECSGHFKDWLQSPVLKTKLCSGAGKARSFAITYRSFSY
jgi:hypothetical protein